MFEKNDRMLLTMNIVVNGFYFVSLAVVLITGITLSAIHKSGLYFIIAFFILFTETLLWVAMKLLLSFFCDVKLIRNKLYGENNDDLKVFFESRRKNSACVDEKDIFHNDKISN